MNKKPLVSIIIPVKNGASTIQRSLNSLINQTYKNIEIIIVDNFSSDDTSEIVKKYSKNDKRIKFYQKGPERGTQMNFAISLAKGKYIFVTNCDMVVDSDYIYLAVKKSEEEGFDAIYTHIVSETNGFWSKVKSLERQMYVNDDLMEAACFYKKKIYLNLGGYDKSLVGVEEEFQHKLDKAGFKTGRINAFETHIDEIDSVREIILKSFYYGLYDTNYFKKHPGEAFKKRFPVRKAFIRHFGSSLQHPDLFLGFIIFKIIQYSMGTSGLLLGLLFQPKKSRVQKLIYGK